MANTPLVPTPRVDKNGRTVIRHMKPGSKIGSGIARAPKVAIAPEQDIDALIEEASTALGAAMGDYDISATARLTRDRARIGLQGFAPATLQRITEYQWTAGTASIVTSELEQEVFTEGMVNDIIMLEKELDRYIAGSYSNWLIMGFPHYEKLETYDFNEEYPQRRAEQCTALIGASLHLANNDEIGVRTFGVTPEGMPLMIIKDEDLQDLILNPPAGHSSQDVADIIIDHSIGDAAHIRRILEFETTGLRNGVL